MAVAENPQLWKEYHDENLIFRKDDFLKPSQSPLFRKVKAMGGECQHLGILLEKACMQSLAACPNLSDLATPKSKLPAWMTVPAGTPVPTRTREVSPRTVPPNGIPAVSAPAQTSSQSQPATWQTPQPTVTQPSIAPTNRGNVIGQGLAQAVVVFIFSLLFYWLWLPVLTAIYTGIGAADADAQGVAWFSDIIICLGIGMYRAKKRQSKRVKPSSGSSTPTVSTSSPRTSSYPRPSIPRTSAPQILNAPIVGSSIRHIYHRASCDWARKISARNRVTFGSVSDAQARGYRQCRICLP
jgi:Metal binding domain of Ada